jgi:hypothetical protein
MSMIQILTPMIQNNYIGQIYTMSLKTLINKLKGKSLSDTDVIKLCGGDVKVILYSDLKKFKTLDQLLKPYGSVIILYRQGDSYGHWTALNKLSETEIEFFDPYAYVPDMELDWNHETVNDKLGQSNTLLINLLVNSPYQVSYNHHRFQSMTAGVATCGRWVCLRVIFKDLSLKEFIMLFKCPKSKADDLATYLTYMMSGI